MPSLYISVFTGAWFHELLIICFPKEGNNAKKPGSVSQVMPQGGTKKYNNPILNTYSEEQKVNPQNTEFAQLKHKNV